MVCGSVMKEYTTSTESNDQCLIFVRWMFSVQFMTPTIHFTFSENNGRVYKAAPAIFGLKLKHKGKACTQVFTVLSKFRKNCNELV